VVRAFAIVDVANFQRDIGELVKGKRYADFRVGKLVEVLRRHEYELSGLALALSTQVVQRNVPLTAIQVGAPPLIPPYLKKRIDKNQIWLQREANWVLNQGHTVNLGFRTLETLPGALDEHGEVGVDDLIAARAMVAAEEIRRDALRQGEEILIFSRDTDLLHLSQYIDGVTLRIVGLGSKLRETHGDDRANWLGLTKSELRFLVPPHRALGPRQPPATGTLKRSEPATRVESRVAVVVDAYGLACSGAAVLNIAELPDVQSVRQCLLDLGLAGDSSDVRSLTFVIPDVDISQFPRSGEEKLTKFEKTAWADRDSHLDQSAADLEADNDPGTNSVRGALAPVHIPAKDRVDPRRLHAQQYIKRHSTLITTTTLRECFNSTAEVVVVMSDCPDVVAALDYVLSAKQGLLGSKRIVRLGIRANPLAAYRVRAEFSVPYCVLTSMRLARLLRLTGPTGRELRSTFASDPELAHGKWEVIAYEPEVGGIRVRSDGENPVTLVVLNVAKLGLHKGQKFSGKKLDLRIAANPSLPIDTLAFEVRGTQAFVPKVAVVVARDANGVSFDYDEDGIPDGSVPLGHDFISLEAKSSIAIGELSPSQHRYLYLAGEPGSQRAEIRAEVVEVGDQVKIRIGDDLAIVHPIQGGSLSALKLKDQIIVIDIGTTGSPHHVVLSSAISETTLFCETRA
jgi:hypothetical protein